MSGLVAEIQAGALDQATSVPTLLRKALAASRKLGVEDMVTWIEHELNGYPSVNDVPSYRRLSGRLQVWNPYRGWQPLNMPPDLAKLAEQIWFKESVAQLESIVTRESGLIVFSLDAGKKNALMKGMDVPMEPALHTSRSALMGILDTVRNHVLSWSLELEKTGVSGEGLSFSPKEVQAASSINYVTNIGVMNNSQLQQHSSGDQNYSFSDPAPLAALMRELIERIAELPKAMRHEVQSDAETVVSQIGSPNPKPVIVKEAVKSIRSILENAAGNALSSDMLPRLIKLAAACGFS